MDSIVKKFTRDFSYSFLLNIVNLIVKSSFALILPKIIGVSEFGYWQLYFLYSFFIAFAHLGLVDGIYLQKGGLYYRDLDFNELRGQFFALIGLGCIWSILILLYSNSYADNINKAYILTIIALDVIFTLPRTLISVIFQMTGMIKEFSISLMSESISSFLIIVTMLLLGIRDFKLLILADFIGRIISLSVSLFNAKDFTKKLPRFNKSILNKSREFIGIGIFLLLSNMTSLVIIGTVRFSIEIHWGIILFSKISLAFSIASIMLAAVGAASVVLFPLLKRIKAEIIQDSFSYLSRLLIVLIMVGQVFYYPFSLLLKAWLPKYIDSIYFLSIILPMTFFDTHFAVIGSNFFKVLRKERQLLWINCIAIVISVVITFITIKWEYSVEYLLYGIITQSIVKVLLTTRLLKEKYPLIKTDFLIINFVITILFIVSNVVLQNILGFVLYLFGTSVLVLIYKNKIVEAVKFLRMN